MISKTVGTLLRENTKTKVWWLKLGVAIIISNIFFFILFSSPKSPSLESSLPEGWVEVQLEANMLTTFQKGKKVILLNRQWARHLVGMLERDKSTEEGRFTILVKEDEAYSLLSHEGWEIIPHLKNITFKKMVKGESHEIRY